MRRGGPFARLLGAVAGLPPAADDAPITVTIDRDGGGETWRRDFDGHVMTSRLSARGGLLTENFGLVRFGFRLAAGRRGLRWRLARASVLGLPLPAGWFAGVAAREFDVDGAYAFEVRAALPLVGLVVDYRGRLSARP